MYQNTKCYLRILVCSKENLPQGFWQICDRGAIGVYSFKTWTFFNDKFQSHASNFPTTFHANLNN